MTENEDSESLQQFEEALAELGRGQYILRLYVTGLKPRSRNAITNVRRICEEHLKDQYTLEVIDLYQQPEKANSEQIIAAPTLIKELPLPMRRLIGDMTQTDRVLLVLDLDRKE